MDRGIKYWARLLSVGLIGGIVLACFMIEIIFVLGFTRPVSSEIGNPPQMRDDVQFESVSLFNAADDISISGWYIPSENQAAVILLHGYGSNRLEMISRAEVLAQHGYGVLLYDLRGHGESSGDVRAFGWKDVNDVDTALDYLSNQEEMDPDRIGILGFSIGGQIAIRAAAEDERIHAVIADDPGFVTVNDAPPPQNTQQRIMHWVSWLDYRLVSLWTGVPFPQGIIEVIGEISPRPILLIATGETGGRDLVRHFYAVADEPKELWEIPEAFHGGQFDARPEEYEEKMITFFNKALLED